MFFVQCLHLGKLHTALESTFHNQQASGSGEEMAMISFFIVYTTSFLQTRFLWNRIPHINQWNSKKYNKNRDMYDR